MAKLVVTYTDDGTVKKELTYRGEVFVHRMVPDECGKTSKGKGFDEQVVDLFQEDDEEILEALDELHFASDEDDIEDCLSALS